jgi:nucleotide-binding universal stress UspA family protein
MSGHPDANRPGSRDRVSVNDRKGCAMKILVATDGSDGGKLGVAEAIQLAAGLDAKIAIVSVRHRPPPAFGIPPYYFSDPEDDHLTRAVVEDAVAEAAAAGVSADGEVLGLSFDAGREIVEAAKRMDADLIVVGSRGRGAVAGTILGSVSRFVVTHADRPVLVAKQRTAVVA